ncbi:PP2C-domain-containing protein [Polyplosphaeria fusca]|uniref:PP2C-domain-containing protein n=1 Tax=Polyplosphaeria fusca TaxID=682080 RepID=A0A9P4R8N5_9PLEO|nr:PP2C-domain-containing protein [Polyplosphaeria fusca]
MPVSPNSKLAVNGSAGLQTWNRGRETGAPTVLKASCWCCNNGLCPWWRAVVHRDSKRPPASRPLHLLCCLSPTSCLCLASLVLFHPQLCSIPPTILHPRPALALARCADREPTSLPTQPSRPLKRFGQTLPAVHDLVSHPRRASDHALVPATLSLVPLTSRSDARHAPRRKPARDSALLVLRVARDLRQSINLAGNKRRSFSSQGGLLNRMFGTSPGKDDGPTPIETTAPSDSPKGSGTTPNSEASAGGEKRSGSNTATTDRKNSDTSPSVEKKRRSSVTRVGNMFSSAKGALHLHGSSPTNATSNSDKPAQTPIQKLGKADPALSVQPGSLNNAAGESHPGPRSTFKVGVTEDKNKKCRRTMEDTHAYLYNFLSTPAPSYANDRSRNSTSDSMSSQSDPSVQSVVETDNGYFAIFDGHAGTFAADWCGKKLHLLLEDIIRKNPNTPIPELLDQTFTTVDQQLEKLPLKNSGCTAVIAVLRWEDRVPNSQSSTGSVLFAPAAVSAVKNATDGGEKQADTATATSEANADTPTTTQEAHPAENRLRNEASRQRVLYTANVGDARIVLCRNGRALRLSYDHKGSDENEGRRVASAGGLILNNRVNGVLAVTRALGDAYMKDLVTGHPYTTETVIQPDQDEFLILACDGLWDVCSDQEAVDLVRGVSDPQTASKTLVDHALARFSTDNLSCMIVRFDNKALKARKTESSIGVDGDQTTSGISEADAIVSQAKKQMGGEPEQSVDKAAAEMIMEEEESEPGPELNIDAVKAAQKKG